MLGLNTKAMLTYALTTASELSNSNEYMRMTGQHYVGDSKSRNSKAKSKRAKDKLAKSSRKKNRRK